MEFVLKKHIWGGGGIFGLTYMMGILKEPVHFTLYQLDFEKLVERTFKNQLFIKGRIIFKVN